MSVTHFMSHYACATLWGFLDFSCRNLLLGASLLAPKPRSSSHRNKISIPIGMEILKRINPKEAEEKLLSMRKSTSLRLYGKKEKNIDLNKILYLIFF